MYGFSKQNWFHHRRSRFRKCQKCVIKVLVELDMILFTVAISAMDTMALALKKYAQHAQKMWRYIAQRFQFRLSGTNISELDLVNPETKCRVDL